MVSVIIPTRHEAQALPRTLERLQGQEASHEVWVVDADSRDGTVELAAAAGAQVLGGAPAQRAAQMNLGAAHARGDVLLFLHADTLLPPGGLARIEEALADARVLGGAFARRFDSPSWFLRWTCWLAAVRGRWLGWHLGDQAMFVRRTVFHALGGFPEWPVFEDLEFSRRLARCGGVVTLRPPVVTAARRFAERGPLRTTWADFWLTVRYLARGGHSPPTTCPPPQTLPSPDRPSAKGWWRPRWSWPRPPSFSGGPSNAN